MKTFFLAFVATTLTAVSATLIPDFVSCPWYIEIPIYGTDKVKTGSGFVLTTSNRVFLVTAKHVLFDLNANTNPLPLLGTNLVAVGWSDDKRERLTVNIGAYRDNNEVRYAVARDVAVILIGTCGQDLPRWNMDRRFVALSGTNASGLLLNVGVARRYSDVRVGEDVFTFGYPISIGSHLPNKGQLDPTRRLAKRGIISDKDPFRRRYILDLPVYFGNSGGPVIAMRDTGLGSYENHLIGVVSEFIPFEDVWISQRYQLGNVTWGNSGYSIAEPIDYVLDLLW